MTADEYRESMRGKPLAELLDASDAASAGQAAAFARFDYVDGGKWSNALAVLVGLLDDAHQLDPVAFDAEVSAWNVAHGREP